MPAQSTMVLEFFKVLEKSKARNGCLILPGNIEGWNPNEYAADPGVKDIHIDEKIHFSGPSPGTPIVT